MSNDNLALSISDTSAATTPSEWLEALDELGKASVLDLKTKALCYLSALAAARLPSQVPLRAARARALGATRDEVTSAILVGLSAVGHAASQ